MATVDSLKFIVNITSVRPLVDEFTVQVSLNSKYIDSNDFAGSLYLPDFIEHVVSRSVARLTKRYLENASINTKTN